jgi:hypothetical protein
MFINYFFSLIAANNQNEEVVTMEVGTFTKKDDRQIKVYGGFCKALYGKDIILKHLKSDLKFMVKAEDIQKQNIGQYDFIDGNAILVNDLYDFHGRVEITCSIACGSLYKLKERIRGNGEVNLLDHLDLLLPKFQSVGLFTYQNGIQNTPKDFKKMGKFIIDNLKDERTLCIGFYNVTEGIAYGFLDDLIRLSDECHLNPISVLAIRQMLLGMANILSSIKSSKVLWTHIAHSEGGLIVNEVLTGKAYHPSHQNYRFDNFIKEHLITLTYGAVAPIPDVVKFAINTYSKEDIVTHRYAINYLNKLPKPAEFEDEALIFDAVDLKLKNNIYKNSSLEEIVAQLKKQRIKDETIYITEYPHPSTKDGYTLTVVKNEVPLNQIPFGKRDHDFAGQTYQKALKEDINYIRKEYKIHACR